MKTSPSAIPRPDALMVDLFHTLVQLDSRGTVAPPTFEILGVTRREWHRVLFADAPGRGTGRVHDALEGLRALAQQFDPPIPDAKVVEASEARQQRFDHALMNPDPADLAALDRIRGLGVRLVLVSNAAVGEIEAWPQSPLAQRFDDAIFSCDVGIVKPDPAIYRLAGQRLDVSLERCLFVGDGGASEHRGARALGIGAVLLRRHLMRMWPEELEERRRHVDHEVHDVAELADRLEAGDGRA